MSSSALRPHKRCQTFLIRVLLPCERDPPRFTCGLYGGAYNPKAIPIINAAPRNYHVSLYHVFVCHAHPTLMGTPAGAVNALLYYPTIALQSTCPFPITDTFSVALAAVSAEGGR
eukprot:9493197-Pyramimonas_sp.AAC.1